MSEIKYPSNSNRSKEEAKTEERRIEKIVTGSVKEKKKSELNKLADVFIADDVKNVKNYMLMDVIVPAIKKVIVDIVSDGIHMIFYGGAKRSDNRSRFDKVSYVDYSKGSSRYSDNRYSAPRETTTMVNFNSDQFVFETRADAEEVLAQMDGIVGRYGVVRVLDLYDALGKTCDHTANRYGWTSTRNAQIMRVSDGYVIKMPRPMPIEN